jgi:plastocyanin
MKSEKKYTGKFFLLCLLALSSLAIGSGCKKSDNSPMPSGSPPANEVWMQNTAFTPSSITVSVNTTITWRNKDSVTHTVTSNTSVFDSGNIAAGGNFTHQFLAAGTYPYHCNIHPGMTGTVIVQ